MKDEIGGQTSDDRNAPPSVGGQTLRASDNSGRADFQGEITIHKTNIGFKIENLESLERDDSDRVEWRSRWIENSERSWEYSEETDSYYGWVNDWKFRITRENVFIHVPERRGRDTHATMDSVMEEVYEARDWLESESANHGIPIKLSNRPVTFRVRPREQEVGIIEHPLARWVDKRDDVSKKDFSVMVDGEERVFLDDTPGNTLESRGEYSEDDISHLEDVIEWRIRNKDKDKRLRESVPDELDSIGDHIKALVQLKLVDELENYGSSTDNTSDSRSESEERGTGCLCSKFAGGKCELRGKRCACESSCHGGSESDTGSSSRHGGSRLDDLESRMKERLSDFEDSGKSEIEELLEPGDEVES